jgi:hypothetical protein
VYQLRTGIEAIQLNADNAGEVGRFAKSARPGVSFDNMSAMTIGALRIYNDGPEVTVALAQWLVALDGQLVVLADDRFRTLFEPA